jgi:hypothetical protein
LPFALYVEDAFSAALSEACDVSELRRVAVDGD